MLYLTVITKNYLPYAQVLMERLKKIDPQADRLVFMVDKVDQSQVSSNRCFEIINIESYVDELDIRSFLFQYTAFELCNVLKPFAHKYVYNHTNHNEWMYFDSDIYPLNHCRCLLEADANASIFLTSHTLSMTPIDHIFSIDANLLRCGVFNGGWLGLRRSSTTISFIEWFLDRARLLFFHEYRNMFVDQLWLNLVPILFPEMYIVRHIGANIGYWNLHERELQVAETGDILCNGLPALFLHFSGWSPKWPEKVSKNLPSVVSNPAWLSVAQQYAAELFEAGLQDVEKQQYDWGYFQDGSLIEIYHRRRFYEYKISGKWPTDIDPFSKPKMLLYPPRPPLPVRIFRRIASNLWRKP